MSRKSGRGEEIEEFKQNNLAQKLFQNILEQTICSEFCVRICIYNKSVT